MGFRSFEAIITLKDGVIVEAESPDPENLYPKTLTSFLKKVVTKLINDNCRSGTLSITSKEDNLVVETTGDLDNCYESIVNEIEDIFKLKVSGRKNKK